MRYLALMFGLLVTLAPVAHAADTAEANAKKPQPGVIPVFSLDKAFTEIPMGEDFLFASGGGESFQQLLTRLEKARDDENVKAIVFLGNSTGLGRGQLEEVTKVVREIKAKGKAIYVHAESLSMQAYVLYSAASGISVVPNGDLWLTGIYAESLHVRGLLEKIGVEPDYLTCGDYKSAAEMFTRKQPSPEAEENLNWLLDGIFASQVELIAQGRSTKEETVRQWIDQGLFSAAEAKDRKIIDEVEFRSEFVAKLKSKYGEKVKFDKKYSKKKATEIDFSSPFGVLKFYADLLAGPQKAKTGKQAIAIVYVEGPILAGKGDPSAFPFGSQGIAYSTPIRNALDKVAQDDSIKAVVLRVNSPGGSAVGSEVILQATRRVREEKPLVVSMGDVAGSGGYYVACGADTIFADPSTITASIGVVAGKLVTRGMWNNIGINWKPYERGESAGILSSDKAFSDRERDTLQSWMDEVYDVFKGHVIAIRGDRLKKDLDDMAGGRVYTGKQALQLGLVDQLGGLNDAIQHIAKKADLKDYDIRIVPRPKNLAELLRQSLMGEEDEEQPLSLPLSQLGLRRAATISHLALPYLKGIEPTRLECIADALRQLEILDQEQVTFPMPIIRFGDR